MTDSDVLYVAGLAAKLGKSEKAIRAAINQKSAGIPPWFRLGKLYAWRVADVDAWLEDKASEAKKGGVK